MELTGIPIEGVPAAAAPTDPADPANAAASAVFAALLTELLTPAPTDLPTPGGEPTTPAATAPTPALGTDPAALPTLSVNTPPPPVPDTTNPVPTGGQTSPKTVHSDRQFDTIDPTSGQTSPKTVQSDRRFDDTRAIGRPPLPETATGAAGSTPRPAPQHEPTLPEAATTHRRVPEQAAVEWVEVGNTVRPMRPARPAPAPEVPVVHLEVHPPALTAAAPLASVDAPTPAVPVEQAVVDQLTDHIIEMTAQQTDGDHEITVQLDPADLGRVELRVRLQNDLIHVQVGAHEGPTAELVRHNLHELRAALEAAGVATGGIDVGHHGLGPHRHAPTPDAPIHEPRSDRGATPTAAPLIRHAVVGDRAVDLLL